MSEKRLTVDLSSRKSVELYHVVVEKFEITEK